MKNIVIIKGSMRPNNYTSMAVNVLIDEINKNHTVSYQIIDPKDFKLPFPGTNDHSVDAVRLTAIVKTATGIIFATPEYHGSFSSVIKLIIENLGFPSALAGKPIGLLGVAAGDIGAVKSLENLRSVCSHVGGIVLPGPVSIPHVRDVFDDDGKCVNQKMENRIRGLFLNLVDYIDQYLCPKVNLEDLVRN
ncbi:NADPH-dependent FMN reductase [Mangrovibacterium lignilyticum]|uniref:NADPH-dependent FMN reductase n=1 Tax=Mangrovibacterium lignilyticum TaxID=2668052 RepID=UPI0013D02550|nr:NAD(P)H-dependent oxidoreductase [Mangrovibacterium lignilyticum]